MHSLTTGLERVSARKFIALVALVAGVLKGLPQILVGSASGEGVGAVGPAMFWVVLGAAILLLWWVAVRRVRSSIWATAGQVTLALALGDLIGFAIGFVAASVQTDGKYAYDYVHAPWGSTLPPLVIVPLLLAPGRLLVTALVVALGRALSSGRTGRADPAGA